tara:strand:- start:59 stop:202 length:144 start_codon:yes stop_codon:yes gene_type:complete
LHHILKAEIHGLDLLGKENKWENLLDPEIEEKLRKVFSKEMKELKYI